MMDDFPEKKLSFGLCPNCGGGGCQIDFDTFLKGKKLGVLHAGGGIIWQCPEGAFIFWEVFPKLHK